VASLAVQSARVWPAGTSRSCSNGKTGNVQSVEPTSQPLVSTAVASRTTRARSTMHEVDNARRSRGSLCFPHAPEAHGHCPSSATCAQPFFSHSSPRRSLVSKALTT
jgi:hypothetical protein